MTKVDQAALDKIIRGLTEEGITFGGFTILTKDTNRQRKIVMDRMERYDNDTAFKEGYNEAWAILKDHVLGLLKFLRTANAKDLKRYSR